MKEYTTKAGDSSRAFMKILRIPQFFHEYIQIHAPRRGAGPQVTSSTTNVVPLPLKGKDNAPGKGRAAYNVGREMTFFLFT